MTGSVYIHQVHILLLGLFFVVIDDLLPGILLTLPGYILLAIGGISMLFTFLKVRKK